MSSKNSQLGFTIIEALISVIIIGILTVLTVPSFMGVLRESRRTDGTSTLINMQFEQEKFRSNNTTYGTLANIWGGVTSSPNGHYTLAVSNLSATTYTLTATAQNDQANDDEGGTSCATLQIVVNGLSESKTPADCW